MSLTNASRFIRALTSEPLAVDRRTFDAFVSVMQRRGLEGMSFDGNALHAELEIASPRAGGRTGSDHNVAIIPLVGSIANRARSMGTSAMRFAAEVDDAAADSRVDAILLDIDSPGGTVTGVPEAAEAVLRARSEKPVTAFVNGLMASAGYWIGSAADEIVATPSSRIGSIGVFTLHEDWSEKLEADGIVVTEISAGRFKTEGAPWKPLDDEAKAHIQAEVVEAYEWFIRDVARFRGDSEANVRSGYGEGRVLGSRDAIAAGLSDRVDSFEGALAGLIARSSSARGSKAAGRRAATADQIRRARRG